MQVKQLVRFALPVAILLAGAGGALALLKTQPGAPPIESREKVWIVEAVRVRPGKATPTLTLYGRIDSPRMAHISAAITADIAVVEVLEGEPSRTGDLLLRLDDREARLLLEQRAAEVADIEAQLVLEETRHGNDRAALGHERNLLELAAGEVERLRMLADSNVGSRSQLDQVRQTYERYALDVKQRELAVREHTGRTARLRAQIARAQSLRERAALDVERAEIRAPFDGRVAKVQVAIGDRVRAGDQLLSFYDTRTIEIRSQIPTTHLPIVRGALDAGMRLVATATVDGVEVEAELDRLTGEVERRSGGADALLRVTQGAAWLQLGRTVALNLALPDVEGVIALPFEAIYGTDRIFLLDGDRMRGVQIERVGEALDSDGEVRALLRIPSLTGDADIITTQLPNAIDGLRVRVLPAS